MYEKEIKLMTVLRKLNKSVDNVLATDLNKLGISATDYSLLSILESSGPIPMQEIGKYLNITSGSITYAVERLVKNNMVSKVQDITDKRKFMVELSACGKNKLKLVNENHLPYLAKVFGSFSKDDLDNITETIKLLGKSMEKNK